MNGLLLGFLMFSSNGSSGFLVCLAPRWRQTGSKRKQLQELTARSFCGSRNSHPKCLQFSTFQSLLIVFFFFHFNPGLLIVASKKQAIRYTYLILPGPKSPKFPIFFFFFFLSENQVSALFGSYLVLSGHALASKDFFFFHS